MFEAAVLLYAAVVLAMVVVSACAFGSPRGFFRAVRHHGSVSTDRVAGFHAEPGKASRRRAKPEVGRSVFTGKVL